MATSPHPQKEAAGVNSVQPQAMLPTGTPPPPPLTPPAATLVPSSEEATPGAARFKTRMCGLVQQGAVCPHGDGCLFAHNEAELRTVAQNIADGLTTHGRVHAFRRRFYAAAGAHGMAGHGKGGPVVLPANATTSHTPLPYYPFPGQPGQQPQPQQLLYQLPSGMLAAAPQQYVVPQGIQLPQGAAPLPLQFAPWPMAQPGQPPLELPAGQFPLQNAPLSNGGAPVMFPQAFLSAPAGTAQLGAPETAAPQFAGANAYQGMHPVAFPSVSARTHEPQQPSDFAVPALR